MIRTVIASIACTEAAFNPLPCTFGNTEQYRIFRKQDRRRMHIKCSPGYVLPGTERNESFFDLEGNQLFKRGELRHQCGESCQVSQEWTVGSWGSCSALCGPGVQRRTVSCKTKPCSDDKPAEERSCEERACPKEWTVGSWGPCSKLCGPGVQRRTVSCSETPCFDDKPAEERSCERRACPTWTWPVLQSPSPCTFGNTEQYRIFREQDRRRMHIKCSPGYVLPGTDRNESTLNLEGNQLLMPSGLSFQCGASCEVGQTDTIPIEEVDNYTIPIVEVDDSDDGDMVVIGDDEIEFGDATLRA